MSSWHPIEEFRWICPIKKFSKCASEVDVDFLRATSYRADSAPMHTYWIPISQKVRNPSESV